MYYFPRALSLFLITANSILAQAASNDERLLNRSPAEFAAVVQQAIADDRPDQAYLNARAWTRSAPGEIPPLTAMASAYLAFDAPAAALQSLESAQALDPDEAESRRIQAIKIQTLLKAGDHLGAWANARDYLRTAAPEDTLAPIISEVHWSAFGEVSAIAPLGKISGRLETSSSSAPLTAARIDSEYSELLPNLLEEFKSAQRGSDPAAVSQTGGQLLHFLLLAHYRPDPARPGTQHRPLYDLPEAKQALHDLSHGEYAALAGSLIQWAPVRESHEEELERLASDSHLPDPPSDMPDAEIMKFLQDAAAEWKALQPKIEIAIQKADTATSETGIIEALQQLTALSTSELAPIEARARHYSRLLQAWLESIDATPGDYPLYNEIVAFADSLASAPVTTRLQDRLAPSLGETSQHSLPSRLATLYFATAQASWESSLAKIRQTDTPSLEDFDLPIVRGAMTPGLWAARLAAAERLQDWPEIVWSGFEAHAHEPQKLVAWLAPLIDANDAQIAAALDRLKSDSEEERASALVDLKRGLERDPTHLAGLEALYNHFLESREDDYAAATLDRLWRLSPPRFAVEDETLALAARTGNWPLLLSLCDHRILRSTTDVQALLHRQIAAIALGLNGLALDSTPAFDGTLYTHKSRVLHSMAITLPNLDYKALVEPLTGLQSTIKQLGSDYDDPDTLLWLALALKVKGKVFRFEKISFDSLATGASPALRAHISFIEGNTDANSYLASFRNTEDEATALFTKSFLTAIEQPSPENLSALSALAGRRDLPLFFRATAAGTHAALLPPPIPLRLSDPFYVSAKPTDWNAIWSALAPGQQLIALGAVELPKNTQQLPILRIAKPPRSSITYLSHSQVFRSRLWELDGVRAFSSHPLTSIWEIKDGGIVAVANASIEGRLFRGKGTIWIETSDLKGVTGTAEGLYLVDVQSQESSFGIYRRLEADQLVASSSDFHFSQHAGNSFNASGRVSNSVFVSDRPGLFKLLPDSSLSIENTRIHTTQTLDASFNSIVFKNSFLSGAAQPQLTIKTGLQFAPINLHEPAQHRVNNSAELAAAVASVRPGERIDLAPGTFVIDKELKLPAGILLRGSNDPKKPSVLTVPYESKLDPVISTTTGDLWLENLTVSVESAVKNGFKMADSRGTRRALRAGPDARVLLRSVDFAAWQQAYPDRPAVTADNAQVTLTGNVPGSLRVENRGRIDFIQPQYGSRTLRLGGNGRIYGDHTYRGGLVVSGSSLTFHGGSRYPEKITFTDGAGDPRTLAWRELARTNLNDTLNDLRKRLPGRLSAARNMDERIDLFKDASRRLAPILRAAQEDPGAAALAISLRLNSIFTSRPDEFPYYMEALYHRGARLPAGIFAAHFRLIPPAHQGALKAHFNALVGSQGRRTSGELNSSERTKLMSFMRTYPVGHAQHARAIDAFNRGETLHQFSTRLADEEKQRRLRAEYEARIALQRQQAALRAATQPAKPSNPWWVNNGGSNRSNSSYTTNYRPSTYQSVRDHRSYSRQLNERIFNRGRDYGKRYNF